jgi:hypothetical protein
MQTAIKRLFLSRGRVGDSQIGKQQLPRPLNRSGRQSRDLKLIVQVYGLE